VRAARAREGRPPGRAAWMRTTMSAQRRDGGFTLLEILVVVAVLSILAAALTPSLLQRIIEARVDATRAKAKNLYEAMVGRQDD
jgi:general secretion pathway protein G